MVDIELNGEPRQVRTGESLASLVRQLGIGQQAVALAVNRQVVPRQQWNERLLVQQDRVDIVRAIGGG